MNVDLGGFLYCVDEILLLLVRQAQILDVIDGVKDRRGCDERWSCRHEGVIGDRDLGLEASEVHDHVLVAHRLFLLLSCSCRCRCGCT